MKLSDVILASRYARAYCKMRSWNFGASEYIAMSNASHALNSAVLIKFFATAIGDFALQEQLIGALIKTVKLPQEICPLLVLLAKDYRVGLFPLVLQHIIRQYDEHHNIEHAVVRTAKVLSEDDEKLLYEWLLAETKKQVTLKIIIDPTLCAGVEVHSSHYAWSFTLGGILADAQRRLKTIEKVVNAN